MSSEQVIPKWKQRAAVWVGRVVVLASIWSFVAIPLHLVAPSYVKWVDLAFDFFGIPAGHTFFSAVYLAVVGSALLRGKRAALLWVLWVFEVLWLLTAVAAVGFTSIRLANPSDPELLREFGEAKPQDLELAIAQVVVVAALVLLLWKIRAAFPARLAPGTRRLSVGALVTGLLISIAVSISLTQVFPKTLEGQKEKIGWAIMAALGQSRSKMGGHEGHGWVGLTVGAISAASLVIAFAIFLRSVRRVRYLSQAEELHVRRLLLEYGERDSLGYFATRRDKAVVFSPDSEAAIAYRVVNGVSLASGDPIGDPASWPGAIQRWLAEARTYGWSPAVLSASEEAARAYVDAGLRALAMGDEAIIDVADFTLEGRTMRPVRQAVTRAQRAGYHAEVVRHGDLSPETLAEYVRLAEKWRGAQTERGFSMALGRLGDPADARCVMVIARDSDGTVRGLLSFAPWGLRGVSLDLMRRDPESVNGLMEFMVNALVEACGDLGVHHISLNFAMFREIFSDAERVGAGPVLRLTNALLTAASRFWQLESLYQSNEKYLPRWSPRLICYSRGVSLAMVLLAAGTAEGFLPAPRPWTRVDSTKTAERHAVMEPDDGQFAISVQEQEQELLRPVLPDRKLTEQERIRRAKLTELVAKGIDPYPVEVPRTETLERIRALHQNLPADHHTGEQASVAGRVLRMRNHGALSFALLQDGLDCLQVMLGAGTCGADAVENWRRLVDIGDHVSVTGEIVTSRRGELSIAATGWTMAAKCLHPLPDKRKGFTDPEARVRQRHLDLVMNPASLQMMQHRSTAVRALRNGFESRGFIEVETPMLQAVHGGANARPFVTHINAYDTDLFLRIAPELFLKRLSVGGLGKVFELNRNFRNEGADATHNPEFTSVEAYQPYADYTVMRELTRELLIEAATAVFGKPVVQRPDGELDISGDWPVITVHDAVGRATSVPIDSGTPIERLRELCADHGVHAGFGLSAGELVLELYDELVEPNTTLPTFYTDFPLETSPLTRTHRTDPRLAERWDLVAFGAEIGTAYSELVDPVEQRRRLTEQSLKAAAGDPEAMSLDEDFLSALEYAMPPTGGLGIGVDRVMMMLTGQNIRATLAFPFVRPAPRG
ncbi:bifunctional lysylphosphatidylglycerol synthetase/lysine--tRNA ligase LysX [Kribbella sp. CA-293567]|uniref:bifunctional lysylphosphatidylglycerol synthetase/lysine--tRNA ligase LysX n=1 Tax=Kribbella sp. CA-293567 TaxID=3002436 RepID=UPI0022DDA935|nr:bifunctional lysylphosphatidylglycerol synthetase/lysine--tRNA ligase LysX [Kribbella sp. CA-293567]WBQ06028.1 bifunctional lysylphosphatidylglycerol synthetase/lysine--tRNA ligase LysX [Kribbella sp. CA-293567]